ncbi:MAG: twin arginine-targeting protein translocase TatC [Micrococcales bacterium 70-64]|nr:twin-arginine translocase subunit TatC [Leifsonia sp.]ODU65247.1 MAG: twin arginine-targeting protein translocase TatC [Leifsonia sp. SCN 70-46]OJX86939.1 MAG: twin arginine-targeting protein translocase TatC [Micrococcales bacterium 70-64]
MSLGDHLRELRKRLFISAIAIVVAAAVAFINWGWLSDLLQLPVKLTSLTTFVQDGMRVPITQLAENHNATISYTTVSSAFDLTVQIGLTCAILLASPVWLYQVFAFLVPGLTGREKKYTFGFFFSAVPLFLAGGVVGWLLFPHMVELLASFTPGQDSILLDAKYYYDFIIKLVLAVGVGFVLPVFLVLLNFVGVLSAQTILRGWRVAVLIIALFCAVATPAVDVISMFLLAIPMVALYFAAVLVATLHDRGAARRLARITTDDVAVADL